MIKESPVNKKTPLILPFLAKFLEEFQSNGGGDGN